MRKPIVVRGLIVVITLWGLVGGAVWQWFQPGSGLVALRSRQQVDDAFYTGLSPKDLTETTSALEAAYLWGVQRDGSEIPPPKPKDDKPQAVSWKVLAVVVRKESSGLLIQVGNDKPTVFPEGQSLPDGSKLEKVSSKSYTIQSDDGNRTTIQLIF